MAILYFSSCTNSEKKQHLAKIDSLNIIMERRQEQNIAEVHEKIS